MSSFRKRINRVGRYVGEYVTDNVPRTICNGFFAVLAYLFLDFLSPLSLLYWVAVLWIGFLAWLLHRRKYAFTAIGAIFFFFIVIFISISAPLLIATDQTRFRYRFVAGTPYLEFPRNEWLTDHLLNHFSERLLVVIQCNGKNVVRLPLLPFEPIVPSGSHFADKPYFRRLPPLAVDQISAYATASVGEIIGGPAKHSLSIELGMSDSSYSVFPVTDVFTRSLGCIDDSIALLPILETLPWDPNNVTDLVLAVRKVQVLKRAYITRAIEIEDLVALKSLKSNSSYKSLLNFISNSIASRMLNGNLFAESRADIRDNICRIVRADEDAFRGQFSALVESFYNELAFEYGNRVYEAQPICQIPRQVIGQFESFKRDDGFLKLSNALRQCFSQDMHPLRCGIIDGDKSAGQQECEGRYCSERNVLASVSQQISFDILDGEFQEIAIGATNERVNIKKSSLSPCPLLRNDQERRFFLEQRQSYDSKIRLETFQCDSPEWLQRYERAKVDFLSTDACRQVWNIDLGEGSSRDLFTPLLTLRCHPDRNSISEALRLSRDDIVRAYKDHDRFTKLVTKVTQFREIANAGRIDTALSMLQAFRWMVKSLCDSFSPGSCVAQESEMQDFKTLEERISTIIKEIEESAIDSDVSTEDQRAKIKSFFYQLAKMDNILIKLGLCDLSAVPVVHEALGKTHAEVCAELGLARYGLVSSSKPGVSFLRWMSEDEIKKTLPDRDLH